MTCPLKFKRSPARSFWQRDPFHPPLQFKPPLVGNVWSVRIGSSYRALARRRDELVVWFWIGSHEEYNKFVKELIKS